MRIEIANVASRLLLRRRDEFVRDASLPQAVRAMISVHLEKPWIRNFWSVAIRAAGPGGENFFDFPVGFAEDGTSWFFPARSWWLAHAQAGHPPAGAGCDVNAHVKFLSREGTDHKFDYAAVCSDRRLIVLGRANFDEERTWWLRAFGEPGPHA